MSSVNGELRKTLNTESRHNGAFPHTNGSDVEVLPHGLDYQARVVGCYTENQSSDYLIRASFWHVRLSFVGLS